MILWALVPLALYLAALWTVAWLSLHPVRIPLFLSPGALGAPQENVEFPCGKLTLRGCWVPAAGARTVAVIAHGYLMNRSEMTPLAAFLWKRGVASLLFEFRAHGRSEGRKCTIGHLERQDVAAAVAYARSRLPGAKVVLIGSSMGAAACALALGDDPALADALVLDSAYSRLSDAIVGWWRFLGGRWLAALLWPTTLVSWHLAGFNPFRVDVAAALDRMGGVPTLLLHGMCDDLARPAEAERNARAVKGPCRLVWFENCGHSEGRWVHPERYESALLEFLQEHGLLAAAEKPLTDA